MRGWASGVGVTALGLVFILSSIPFILSEETLSVTVNLGQESYEFNQVVTIYGVVTDTSGEGVENALISIQVDGPDGIIVHLAMVISDENGDYTDQFLVPGDAKEGPYTIYVTAGKPGYSVGEGQATYTVIPELPSPISLLALTLILITLLGGGMLKSKSTRIPPNPC